MGLEEAGITPDSGEILVTGAAGGVGSTAVALLAALGYQVAALTGRPEEQGEMLIALGASRIVPRGELLEPAKPLEKQLWAGAVDTVGSQVLAKLLAQMNYGGAVAACGLAGGFDLPATVMPFILRNVRLQGVDICDVPAGAPPVGVAATGAGSARPLLRTGGDRDSTGAGAGGCRSHYARPDRGSHPGQTLILP
ncbi:hypothetical protein LGKMAHEF_00044 [Aeromonas salmonicida]|nr:quinone oxidoreductase YhdH/YhfP family [Aeromonas salmonicida]SUU74157.1 quinone oxidoreductase YhdH/YhfP family [Aeromonas salmonicida]